MGGFGIEPENNDAKESTGERGREHDRKERSTFVISPADRRGGEEERWNKEPSTLSGGSNPKNKEAKERVGETGGEEV